MLTVVSIYLLLNLIESQFVTPTLLGKRFNLNPLVIFVWLVFWGWLWGGMGLLIGVPLLVCINILVDRLELCQSTQNQANKSPPWTWHRESDLRSKLVQRNSFSALTG